MSGRQRPMATAVKTKNPMRMYNLRVGETEFDSITTSEPMETAPLVELDCETQAEIFKEEPEVQSNSTSDEQPKASSLKDGVKKKTSFAQHTVVRKYTSHEKTESISTVPESPLESMDQDDLDDSLIDQLDSISVSTHSAYSEGDEAITSDDTAECARLDQISDRLFATVLPASETAEQRHCDLVQAHRRLGELTNNGQALVVNCGEANTQVSTIFNSVQNCPFDLQGFPNLATYIAFCERLHDWWMLGSSRVVLIHAEGTPARTRLLLLLHALGSYYETHERYEPTVSAQLKKYITSYPNGTVTCPVGWLRNFHSKNSCSKIIHFIDNSEPNCPNVGLRLRGDIVMIAYHSRPYPSRRLRLFRLHFHSCQGLNDPMYFQHCDFDDICEVTVHDELINNTTNDGQSKSTYSHHSNLIGPPGSLSPDQAVRLHDSLENIANLPSQWRPRLVRFRSFPHLDQLSSTARSESLWSGGLQPTLSARSDPCTSMSMEQNQSMLMNDSDQSVYDCLPEVYDSEPMEQLHERTTLTGQNRHFPGPTEFWYYGSMTQPRGPHATLPDPTDERLLMPPPTGTEVPKKHKRSAVGKKLLNLLTRKRQSSDNQVESTTDESWPNSQQTSDNNSLESFSAGIKAGWRKSRASLRGLATSKMGPPNKARKIETTGMNNEKIIARGPHATLPDPTDERLLMPPPTGTEVPKKHKRSAVGKKLLNLLTRKRQSSDNQVESTTDESWPNSQQTSDNNSLESFSAGIKAGWRKSRASLRGLATSKMGPPNKARKIETTGMNNEKIIASVPVGQFGEDLLEAARRLNFMAGTQELDRLLEELRLTSLQMTSGLPPSSSHPSPRTYTGYTPRMGQQGNNLQTSQTQRYQQRNVTTRSSSASGLYGSPNSHDAPAFPSNSTGGFQTNYQSRYNTNGTGGPYQSERRVESFSKSSQYHPVYRSLQTSPCPPVNSLNQHQTTYTTVLKQRPPTLPRQLSQVHLTIDPDCGANQQSTAHTSSSLINGHDTVNRREHMLESELTSARRELAQLRRAMSLIEERQRTDYSTTDLRRAGSPHSNGPSLAPLMRATSYSPHHTSERQFSSTSSSYHAQHSQPPAPPPPPPPQPAQLHQNRAPRSVSSSTFQRNSTRQEGNCSSSITRRETRGSATRGGEIAHTTQHAIRHGSPTPTNHQQRTISNTYIVPIRYQPAKTNDVSREQANGQRSSHHQHHERHEHHERHNKPVHPRTSPSPFHRRHHNCQNQRCSYCLARNGSLSSGEGMEDVYPRIVPSRLAKSREDEAAAAAEAINYVEVVHQPTPIPIQVNTGKRFMSIVNRENSSYNQPNATAESHVIERHTRIGVGSPRGSMHPDHSKDIYPAHLLIQRSASQPGGDVHTDTDTMSITTTDHNTRSGSPRQLCQPENTKFEFFTQMEPLFPNAVPGCDPCAQPRCIVQRSRAVPCSPVIQETITRRRYSSRPCSEVRFSQIEPGRCSPNVISTSRHCTSPMNGTRPMEMTLDHSCNHVNSFSPPTDVSPTTAIARVSVNDGAEPSSVSISYLSHQCPMTPDPRTPQLSPRNSIVAYCGTPARNCLCNDGGNSTGSRSNLGNRTWNLRSHHRGSESDLVYKRVTSVSTSPGQSGYSAHRERLRQEREQELLMRQQRQRQLAASSLGLHEQHLQRQTRTQQQYRSLSAVNTNPNGEAFEEVETIALQPIGRGVQDIDSRAGSMTTLHRGPGGSMMDGMRRHSHISTVRSISPSIGPNFRRSPHPVPLRNSLRTRSVSPGLASQNARSYRSHHEANSQMNGHVRNTHYTPLQSRSVAWPDDRSERWRGAKSTSTINQYTSRRQPRMGIPSELYSPMQSPGPRSAGPIRPQSSARSPAFGWGDDSEFSMGGTEMSDYGRRMSGFHGSTYMTEELKRDQQQMRQMSIDRGDQLNVDLLELEARDLSLQRMNDGNSSVLARRGYSSTQFLNRQPSNSDLIRPNPVHQSHTMLATEMRNQSAHPSRFGTSQTLVNHNASVHMNGSANNLSTVSSTLVAPSAVIPTTPKTPMNGWRSGVVETTTTRRVYADGMELNELDVVQSTAPLWYRPQLSREMAINILRQQPPGSFLIRGSTTFKGAYGLAVKVATLPPKVTPKSNDLQAELVRHYLIEVVNQPSRGVRLKGFASEPVFNSLAALIHQHTLDPLALPCRLILPTMQSDLPSSGISSLPPIVIGPIGRPMTDSFRMDTNGHGIMDAATVTSSGSVLGRTPSEIGSVSPMDGIPSSAVSGAATPISVPIHDGTPGGSNFPFVCVQRENPPAMNGQNRSPLDGTASGMTFRCLMLGSVDTPQWNGDMCFSRAVDQLIPLTTLTATECDHGISRVRYTEVQLHVSAHDGVTIIDLQRKLFLRRHLPNHILVHCGLESRKKEFVHPEHQALGISNPRIFGVVVRKGISECTTHVFSECDPAHTADLVVQHIQSTYAHLNTR